MYCETAKRLLCYFTSSESKALYEASPALVRTYASHQVQSGAWQEMGHTSSNRVGPYYRGLPRDFSTY